MADRRLCLITGASAGIGAALARVYAAHGWDVALTARRADRLKSLADEIRLRFGVEALTVPADLADPSAPERLLQDLEGRGRHVDALVNNAGYGLPRRFTELALKEHQAFLQVLLVAPTELCHRLAPAMADRAFGRIMNVCSLAGFMPGTAGATLYGPVKAYLIRFSQGLHLELRDRGVHVNALCPGYTYSEFHDVTGSRDALRRQTPEWIWMGSDAVAEAGYEATEANRPICVPGAPNKAAAALLKLAPDEWMLHLAGRRAERIGRL